MAQMKKDVMFILISILMIWLFAEERQEVSDFLWVQIILVAFAAIWKGKGLVMAFMNRGKSNGKM
jgi:hypothetical protein